MTNAPWNDMGDLGMLSATPACCERVNRELSLGNSRLMEPGVLTHKETFS
jgi:hypothetical protein